MFHTLDESPKILLTHIHQKFNELYWIWWADNELRFQMEEAQKVLTVAADEMMLTDAYPDRMDDRSLIQLSYMLPPVLSASLLRHRLVRGLALRDFAQWSRNPVVD